MRRSAWTSRSTFGQSRAAAPGLPRGRGAIHARPFARRDRVVRGRHGEVARVIAFSPRAVPGRGRPRASSFGRVTRSQP
jgi:hypothetical protein